MHSFFWIDENVSKQALSRCIAVATLQNSELEKEGTQFCFSAPVNTEI